MVKKFENSSYKDYDKYLEYRKKEKEKEYKRWKLIQESLKTECLFCGKTDKLVFHHVNASEKKAEVMTLRTKKGIREELPKCWCLCESCHTKLHQRLCDPLPDTYDTRCSVPEWL